MFKNIRDIMDVVVRHKTRLVLKRYLQVVGIDFNETYTLVIKPLLQLEYQKI